MELKEVEQFIESNTEFQEKLKQKFTVTKEIPYTVDGVKKFLDSKEGQAINDTNYEKARKKVYSKLLGKDEITEDDFKSEFVTKAQYEEINSRLVLSEKEYAVKEIAKDKFDIVKNILDFNKINKKEDGTWEGLEHLGTLIGGIQPQEPTKQPTVKVPTSAPTPPKTKGQQMAELLEKGKKGDKSAMTLYNKMKREN